MKGAVQWLAVPLRQAHKGRMTNGPIDKIAAARTQLDRAIHLLDVDTLSAHALAYNAYCLLRLHYLLGWDLEKMENWACGCGRCRSF